MAKNKKSRKSAKAVEAAVDGATEAATLQIGSKETAVARDIPLSHITEDKENNPRKNFNEDELAALGKLIKTQGLLAPIIVRPDDKKGEGHFKLADGRRRFRAVKALGWETVPAIIRTDLDDVDAIFIALTTGGDESAASVPLTAIEQGEQFAKLRKEYKLSVEEIAKRAGNISTRTVRRYLELVEAPGDILKLVEEGKAGAGAATELNKHDKKERDRILEQISGDITETAIRKAAKDIASEETERVTKGDGKKHNRATGSERSANLTIPRSRKVIAENLGLFCKNLIDLRENGEKGVEETIPYIALFSNTYTLLWVSGEFSDDAVLPPIGDVQESEVEPDADARKSREKKFWKRVEYHAAIQAKAESRKQKKDKKNKDKEDAEAEAVGA